MVLPIPYQHDFTLIGTTDQTFVGDPAAVLPTGAEIDYLCGVVNEYFRKASARPTWCGRLPACARSMTMAHENRRTFVLVLGREYVLSLDERPGEAPLLTVYGGKITTYRRLAEDAMAKLAHFFPRTRAVDRAQPLAGRRFRL